MAILFYRNGEIIEKLCPDGMVFNDYSPQEEKCDLPFNLDCSQRPKLRKLYSTMLYIIYNLTSFPSLRLRYNYECS